MEVDKVSGMDDGTRGMLPAEDQGWKLDPVTLEGQHYASGEIRDDHGVVKGYWEPFDAQGMWRPNGGPIRLVSGGFVDDLTSGVKTLYYAMNEPDAIKNLRAYVSRNNDV